MRTLTDAAPGKALPRHHIALLAGAYAEPEDFVRQGFTGALRAHGIAAPVTMAPVRAAWFADGSIVERLHEAVVGPARAQGCEQVWFAGISLGALAALCYAARHEAHVRGILLLSPYPATREVLLEMEAAGGPARWKPQVPREGDLEREAWRWLLGHDRAQVPVHCYFTSGDRFVAGQRRMAGAADPGRVHERPGGHDWPAWRALWSDFLERSRAELQ